MLLFGIAFANLLLLFGLGLPQCLEHYEASIRENMLSPYQYILNMPVQAMDEGHKLESALTMLQFRRGVETDEEGAEKFTAYTLKTLGDEAREEDVMVYGVEPDGRYVPIHCRAGEAYVSSAYADKYRLTAGDSITLKEPYEDTTYTLHVAGVVDYLASLAIFLEREQANELFDLGRGYFSGYFSDRPMEDLEERYVGSVIDLNALTKVSRQLDVSMGSMMYMVDGFAVVVYLVLLYLLSKLILERSALSISLTKILGYSNGEIARLYLLATSVMVVLSLLVTLPVVYRLLLVIFRKMLMAEMSGWIPLVLDDSIFLTIFALGLGSYAVVAALEYRRICAIPMEEALKNVE
jgi:putative ABC transport system permease protein